MSTRTLRLAVWVSTALLIAGLAFTTQLLVWRLESTADTAAAGTVERAARAAEAAINRQFLAIDGMLAGLPPLLQSLTGGGRPDPVATSQVLRDLTIQNFNFRNLLLVREDGTVWAGGLPESRRRPLPLPAEMLATAAGSGSVTILGPVASPATGEWTLFFARQTSLVGLGRMLAVAEVPVPQIATMLHAIGDGPGIRITVERRDGSLLASLPHDESAIGRRIEQTLALTDGLARLGEGRLSLPPAMLAARLTLYRDILVSVGWERSRYAEDLWADRQRLLLGTSGTGLLLLLLAFALDLALQQRERGEAERATARKTLESAIEAMSDGFVMFDAQDRLVVANNRYRELYAESAPFIVPGTKFETLIRAGVANGQYPQAAGDHERFIAEVCAWHRGDHRPMERLLPDGRWLLVTERSTPDGGTVGIRTDISSLKQTNAELMSARDAAAAATRAKSLFLARMSHELRTPLNGVLGLAQSLASDPALPPEARNRAATLQAAGRHMVAVANDLLDLARAEDGRLELHPTDCQLPTVLAEAVELIRPAALDKSVAIEVELDPDLPGAIHADATRLRQLLLNLLSNAVKFAPTRGQVRLAARRLPSEGATLRVRLEVRDDGPGVPPEARQAVFGDFVQVAGGHARGGAGLGLAIVAQIVARMGGEIGCDAAAPTGGALFWVELPLQPAEAAAPARDPAPTTAALPGPGRPLRILVVDDVPSNLAVARALLGSAGHTVVCQEGGAEALDLLAASEPFDAVLMDLMMPGMDGLETTRRLRAMPGPAAKVPILAVTASAFAEDIAACLAAGMDGHLAKPIERTALLDALERLPSGVARAGPLPPLLEAPKPAALAIPGLDPDAARRLQAAFTDEVAEASAALGAADPADVAALAAAAHRLAGAAATLGASRLAAQARRLEAELRRPTGLAPDALRCATVATASATLTELREATRVAA